MADVESVDASLARLSDALAPFTQTPPEPGTGAWTMYQSLLRRQAELFHERSVLAGEYQVELDLVGSPVIGHSIDSKFLGGLLGRFQDAVTSVTQTLMAEARDRGSWGQDVLSSSRMLVTATAPGSFIIGLEGPQRAVQLSALGNDEAGEVPSEDEPVFDEALDLVLDVLEAANNDMSSGPLLESASVAGGRAVKHLQSLAKEVAGHSVVARIVHRSPLGGEPRRVQFGYAAAHRMATILSRTETAEETLEVTGRLVGASWLRKRFEIQTVDEDDGTEVVYRGTVNVDLRGRVQEAFDTEVHAVLEKTTVTSELELEPTVSWHLVSISRL